MAVLYKFKNDLHYTKLYIDDNDISVRDLKKAIVEAKKFGKITDFDLIVSDSDNDKVYADDDKPIKEGTSLIIARHPLPQGQKKVWEEEKAVTVMKNTADSVVNSDRLFASAGNAANLSEDDRISQMMSNSTDMYSQKNWLLLKGRSAYAGQKVPATYKCNRCGQHGHFIYDCPQGKNNPGMQEIKKTHGIPRSFMVPATADTPGVKINPQGIITVCSLIRPDYYLKRCFIKNNVKYNIISSYCISIKNEASKLCEKLEFPL